MSEAFRASAEVFGAAGTDTLVNDAIGESTRFFAATVAIGVAGKLVVTGTAAAVTTIDAVCFHGEFSS
jgi:hypothetical protein